MHLLDPSMSGDLWRVTEDLPANTTRSLVIPRPALGGPTNIGGQLTVARRDGITILGYVIDYVFTGAGTITLESADDRYPTLGATTDNPIQKITRAAAAVGTLVVTPCYIPLTPAAYQFTPTNGATLQIQSSTNVTGSITIWGIHGQLDIGGRNAFTGSPVDYSTGA